MENPNTPMVGRIIGCVFGFVFFGIGAAFVIYLWSQPFGGFGSPPLFFRIVGSLISLGFLAVGGGIAFAAITGRRPSVRVPPGMRGRGGGARRGGTYECPQCGAPLDAKADVSPSGDVRCTFCNAWFNVHGR